MRSETHVSNANSPFAAVVALLPAIYVFGATLVALAALVARSTRLSVASSNAEREPLLAQHTADHPHNTDGAASTTNNNNNNDDDNDAKVHHVAFSSGRSTFLDVAALVLSLVVAIALVYRALSGNDILFRLPKHFIAASTPIANAAASSQTLTAMGHPLAWLPSLDAAGWCVNTLLCLYILIRSSSIDRCVDFIQSLPLWFYLLHVAQFLMYGILKSRQVHDNANIIANGHHAGSPITVGAIHLVGSVLLAVLDIIQRLHVDAHATPTLTFVGRQPWREVTSSPFGRAFFSWIDPLIINGNKRPLEDEDLWDLKPEDTSAYSMRLYHKLKATHPKRGFVFVTLLACWKLMALEVLCSFFSAILSITTPYCLNRMLNSISKEDHDFNYSFMFLVGMFMCTVSKALFDGQMYLIGRRVSLRVRSITVELIYEKSLRRAIIIEKSKKFSTKSDDNGVDDETADAKTASGSTSNDTENCAKQPAGDNKAEKKKSSNDEGKDEDDDDHDDGKSGSASVGKVITMMSVDAESFRNFIAYAHRIILETPLSIILSVGALFYTLGWSAFASITVMVLNGPAGALISNKISQVQTRFMKATDARVNITNETLQGIRVIKYFSWEQQFTKRINRLRDNEIAKLFGVWLYYFAFEAVSITCSLMITFVTFGCYTLIFKHELTPQVAFTAIALLNQVTSHIVTFPYDVIELLKLRVALKRIERFLDEPELERYAEPDKMAKECPRTAKSPVIGFENATFLYEGSENGSQDPMDSPERDAEANSAERTAYEASAMDIPGLETDLLLSDTEPTRIVHGSVAITPSRRLSGFPSHRTPPVGRLADVSRGSSQPPSPISGGRRPSLLPQHLENAHQHTVNNDTGIVPDTSTTTAATVAAAAAAVSSATTGANDEQSSSGFMLKDLNVSFPIGKLSIVCGPTGCGKTSLLHALLGEMKRVKGRYYLPSSSDPKNQVVDPATGFANTVAYASQSAWLINATIRNNILLGEPYDEKRYRNVIHACALARDFETLSGGDMTEICEKGINVSGGQKARISLARAAYSRAKTILLDDVIAAVDAPTARHLVQQCFLGVLKNRTCILVSHAVGLVVPISQYVVVMKSGEVVAQGPPSEVVQNSKAESVFGLDLSNPLADDLFEEDAPNSDVAAKKGEGQTLVEAEVKSTGSVDMKVYWLYFKAAGGILFIVLFSLTFLFHNTAQLALDTWLKMWSDSSIKHLANSSVSTFSVEKGMRLAASYYCSLAYSLSSILRTPFIPLGQGLVSLSWTQYLPGMITIDHSSQPGEHAISSLNATSFSVSSIWNPSADHGPMYFLSIYGFLGFLVLLAQLVQSGYVIYSTLKASKYLHNVLLEKVMGAPLRFFEVTPIGRILNRFSKDISSIDQNTVWSILSFFQQVIRGIYILCTITAISPLFGLAVIPVIMVYRKVAVLYLNASRELKRLDSVTRSPLYSMFSETLNGVTTIRAYGCEARMLKDQREKLDANHRAYFVMWIANRWLCLRTDLIGAFVMLFSGSAVLLSNTTPGWAGLVLIYAISFSESLLWTIRMHAEMEMNMNSVERIMEYTAIEQEPAAVSKEYPPAPTWPDKGHIKFDHLTVSYAPDLPSVLSNLSFDIQGGHKVGVVGRTGAGKSTLSLALFRILKFKEGTIIIDGMDISRMGLQDLRSKLTIIPQDPVLFSGTLRSNLDPFDKHSDATLWEALKRVHVLHSVLASLGLSKKRIAKLLQDDDESSVLIAGDGGGTEGETGLETEPTTSTEVATLNKDELVVSAVLDLAVKENGDNFSQGQRQLICLARAILRNTRIIVMDEATASVDYETDARIQATMRTSFRNATVLTIAHRLRTIMDYDRVLVLDKGQVAEYGTPYELATRKDGIFAAMVADSGDSDSLLEIASLGTQH